MLRFFLYMLIFCAQNAPFLLSDGLHQTQRIGGLDFGSVKDCKTFEVFLNLDTKKCVLIG
ncbi:hypothetical protein DAI22_08g028933 [Oryza sativa Japonica Group]|nr:hypothetical protein DAI22_08g028933 [Oryza sativa Japonica Group]